MQASTLAIRPTESVVSDTVKQDLHVLFHYPLPCFSSTYVNIMARCMITGSDGIAMRQDWVSITTLLQY